MTIIAGDGLMRPVQAEICCEIVIESCRVPRFAAVARTTVVAAMPVVIIVFEVAAYASHVHSVRKRIRAVAVGTGQCSVFELERKICVVVVVKTGVIPGAGIVAVFTLLAAATLM